jgi:AraC family transcriptional regulator
MEPKRYENTPPMVIAGLAGDFTAATRSQIPALWMRFAPHIGKVKDEVGKAAYGVVTDMMSGKNAMHYLSGVEVKGAADLPPDFESVSIPAQRYAVFSHDGHVSRLSETIGAIGRDWWPKSGLTHAEAPDLIERYGEEFDPATGLGGMEIWIPIKA